MRKADGPMSAPSRPPPRSRGTPMMWTAFITANLRLDGFQALEDLIWGSKGSATRCQILNQSRDPQILKSSNEGSHLILTEIDIPSPDGVTIVVNSLGSF